MWRDRRAHLNVLPASLRVKIAFIQTSTLARSEVRRAACLSSLLRRIVIVCQDKALFQSSDSNLTPMDQLVVYSTNQEGREQTVYELYGIWLVVRCLVVHGVFPGRPVGW